MYLSVSKEHLDGCLSRNRHLIINWNRLPDVFVFAEHLCQALSELIDIERARNQWCLFHVWSIHCQMSAFDVRQYRGNSLTAQHQGRTRWSVRRCPLLKVTLMKFCHPKCKVDTTLLEVIISIALLSDDDILDGFYRRIYQSKRESNRLYPCHVRPWNAFVRHRWTPPEARTKASTIEQSNDDLRRWLPVD